MFRYTLRRLAWLPIILFGASLLVFILLRTLPGQDPAKAIGGQGATEEDYQEIRQELGLDKPLWQQYTTWLGDVATGDLIKALSGQRIGAAAGRIGQVDHRIGIDVAQFE